MVKEDFKEKLEKKGYTVEHGKLYSNAWYISGKGNILEDKLYTSGMFSIQDESSQLAAAMVDPKHGDLVIDVCAAPGGKTLAMAERMNNTGKIIAADIYKRKLNVIESEARRLGVRIVETKPWDGTRIDSTLVEKADRVLVDAPCSGLGVIRRKPEIKYKKRTAEIDLLPRKQLEILTASSSYVKPGGVLVYSTCTINPHENQEVIVEFLRKNPKFKKEEAIQLFPNVNGTDGFFICKMRKEELV